MSYSNELTRQVLREIGLSELEIKLYILSSKRKAVSVSEMSLILSKSEEETKDFIQKYVEKGLFREVVGVPNSYKTLPPYNILVNQLKNFHKYIVDIKTKTPQELSNSFSNLEDQNETIKKIKAFPDILMKIKMNLRDTIEIQKNQFEKSISEFDKTKVITNSIVKLEKDSKKILDDQIEDLKTQLDGVNEKIAGLMDKQAEEFKNRIEVINTKIRRNLKKLQLGVVQRTVDQIIEKTFAGWLEKTSVDFNKQLEVIQKAFEEGLEKIIDRFNTQFTAHLTKTIANTIIDIESRAASTEKPGDGMEQVFTDIRESFDEILLMTEKNDYAESEDDYKSLNFLSKNYSESTSDTLDKAFRNILKKLKSIIQEQMKIFVPILEGVWMSNKKDNGFS